MIKINAIALFQVQIGESLYLRKKTSRSLSYEQSWKVSGKVSKTIS